MIKGIRSVDFIVTATGEGVVNHNGAFSVYNPVAKSTVKNHLFPKMRGADPMQRVLQKDAQGSSWSMRLDDPAIAKAKLVVSAECIRSGIFKDVSFGLSQVTMRNVDDILCSLHGLVRGYLITENQRNFARKSPLYCTDFECANPGLSFNQGSNAKVRGTELENTSLYSFFKTDNNLSYKGKLTLSVEDLQFIPLENSLGRSARDAQVSVKDGQKLAKRITEYLSDIAAPGLSPQATFWKRAQRKGSVCKVGDAGISLNDDALRVIIEEIRTLIETLLIRQSKGFLQVTNVVVDFNDSPRVFRAEQDAGLAEPSDAGDFARYYEEAELSDDAFIATQKLQEKLQEKLDKDRRAEAKAKQKAQKDEEPAPSKDGTEADVT